MLLLLQKGALSLVRLLTFLQCGLATSCDVDEECDEVGGDVANLFHYDEVVAAEVEVEEEEAEEEKRSHVNAYSVICLCDLDYGSVSLAIQSCEALEETVACFYASVPETDDLLGLNEDQQRPFLGAF